MGRGKGTLAIFLGTAIALQHLTAAPAQANDYSDEFSARTDPSFTGSNTSYENSNAASSLPTELQEAPGNFSPSYSVLFARHGSRTASDTGYYDRLISSLESAGRSTPWFDATQTELGKEVENYLRQLRAIHNQIGGGDLTELGRQESRELANGFATRNKELLSRPEASMRLEASTKARSIETAEIFAEQLSSSDLVAAQIPDVVVQNKEVLQNQDVPESPAEQRRQTYLRTDPGYQAVKDIPENWTAQVAPHADQVFEQLHGSRKPSLYGYCGGQARDLFEARAFAELMSVEREAAGVGEFPAIPGAEEMYRSVQQCTAIDEFYKRGVGLEGQDHSNANGLPLLRQIFAGIDASANNDEIGQLLFSHNEILTPFNAVLAIPEIGANQKFRPGEVFNYETYPLLNQAQSDPMMGNIEWNVFEHENGTRLVRVQHNERAVHFGRSCRPVSEEFDYFYLYEELKACLPDAGQSIPSADELADARKLMLEALADTETIEILSVTENEDGSTTIKLSTGQEIVVPPNRKIAAVEETENAVVIEFNDGSRIEIPKGPKGEPGERGPKGEPGEPAKIVDQYKDDAGNTVLKFSDGTVVTIPSASLSIERQYLDAEGNTVVEFSNGERIVITPAPTRQSSLGSSGSSSLDTSSQAAQGSAFFTGVGLVLAVLIAVVGTAAGVLGHVALAPPIQELIRVALR